MTLVRSFTVDHSSTSSEASDSIVSKYKHVTTSVDMETVPPHVSNITHHMIFKTKKKVPKIGIMLVGWGGNNGSTLTGSMVANKNNIAWKTKDGLQKPNFFGSLLLSSTTRLGTDAKLGKEIYIPLHNLLPMVDPSDIEIGGWDISSFDMSLAMERAAVLDYDLQQNLHPYVRSMKPLPSVYYPEFVAENQFERADNIITGDNKQEHLDKLRSDIQDFKKNNSVESVIVVWTATTEKFSSIVPGVNDSAQNLNKAISNSHPSVSPSTLFAVASILEGCTFINGSPQNTFVPGCIELAENYGVSIAGDDFKSGQTKLKSVMVDFLIGAGLRPRSIVSYNHLGNNDGKNLSAPSQFRSKEISKANVVHDMVSSNEILYNKENGSCRPDHAIVIKYIPAVGDTKRALDEYESDIFMNGRNTIVVHNSCEDSLLAAPIILDLVIMAEICSRISFKTIENNGKMHENGQIKNCENNGFHKFHVVLSVLSYWLKAPIVPDGAPVINALFKQRFRIENLLRICAGLPVETELRLEHCTSSGKSIGTS